MLKKLYFKKALTHNLLLVDKYVFLGCSNLDANVFYQFKLFCRASQIKCFFLPKRLKPYANADFLILLSSESQVKDLETFLSKNASFFLVGFSMNKTFFYFSDLRANNLSLLELFSPVILLGKLQGVLKHSVFNGMQKLLVILNKHGNS